MNHQLKNINKSMYIKMKKVLLLLSCWLLTVVVGAQNFVTEWTFPSAQSTIQFYASSEGAVNYTWTSTSNPAGGSGNFIGGGGNALSGVSLNIPIAAGDVVTLSMAPENLRRFGSGNTAYLTDVKSWGAVPWSSMNHAFSGCINLNITATDLPDLTNVQNMSNMFYDAVSLNGPANINDWNTGNVTDMSFMFVGAHVFNQDISSWETGNVTDMSFMFAGAHVFNQDIGSWETGNVTDMQGMFLAAYAFNQDISSWKTGKVTDMSEMFRDAIAFNQNLGAWDLISLANASSMFAGSGVSCENYSLTLKDWLLNPGGVAAGVNFSDQLGMVYANTAAIYRDVLIANGWTIDGDAAALPGSPCYDMTLPVTFGDISAMFKNGQLIVNWQTLTETNNSYFEIEASTDGKNFTKIGEVKSLAADGNSSTTLDYSFSKDASTATGLLGLGVLALALGLGFTRRGRKRMTGMLAITGVLMISFSACTKNNADTINTTDADLFIRIKQVDKDGSFKYSKTVKVVNNE
jgi:surface protein